MVAGQKFEEGLATDRVEDAEKKVPQLHPNLNRGHVKREAQKWDV